MSRSLEKILDKQKKIPEFTEAYENMQPDMNIIHAITNARLSQNLTQKELAEKTGIDLADISMIENGTRNPSITLLQKLAEGMGMVLKISFESKVNLGEHTPFPSRTNMKPSEELRTKIKEIDELVKIYEPYGIRNLRVFGSVARGEDTEESDIDFAVDVGEGVNGKFPGLEYFSFCAKLENLFKTPVHITDYTACDDYLVNEIDRDGKRYDKC